MVTILIAVIAGYLLGSIPTGVWLGRLIKGLDIREHGSGSMGATNVFRVLGAKVAILVLTVDIAKGYLACYLASSVNMGDTMLVPTQLAIIGGISAVIGHLYPLFAGFKGGKGIATGGGLLLYLIPLEVGFALTLFVLTVYITRYVSVGSILAVFFLFASAFLERYYFHYPIEDEIIAVVILLMILALYTHRSNIQRLLAGTENRFGKKTGS